MYRGSDLFSKWARVILPKHVCLKPFSGLPLFLGRRVKSLQASWVLHGLAPVLSDLIWHGSCSLLSWAGPSVSWMHLLSCLDLSPCCSVLGSVVPQPLGLCVPIALWLLSFMVLDLSSLLAVSSKVSCLCSWLYPCPQTGKFLVQRGCSTYLCWMN